MTPEDHSRLEARFESLIKPHFVLMDREMADHVRHYLDAGELEMAFESFVLSSIELQIGFAADERVRLIDLGKLLGLQDKSVFKADFWARATRYLEGAAT